MGEADAVELHGIVGLGRLVPDAFAVRAGDLLPARGGRELGDVQFLAQRGVLVEDLLHPIQREPHGPRLVGLDADPVERHAVLLRRGQQPEEPRAAVGQHVVVVDDQVGPRIGLAGPAVGLVDLRLRPGATAR